MAPPFLLNKEIFSLTLSQIICFENMTFIDNILLHYGWQGVALAAVILLAFFVQLYYYIFVYGVIPSHKSTKKQRRLENNPPMSVVIAMFAEDYDFVERRLPLILEQRDATFEVVLVYVGSDNDFYQDLQRVKEFFPMIVATKIQYNPRNPISPKMALNVGIKSAHYEHIILTTTDAVPQSEKWLSLMSLGFTRSEVVVGYCGIEPLEECELEGSYRPKKLTHYLISCSRMMDSVQWLSAAAKGFPYRGIRHSIGFTKSAYYNTSKGFGDLDLNVGEHDLFLQKIMHSDNTSPVMSPKATLREKIWGGMSWWMNQLRYYGSTRCRYPNWVAGYMSREMSSRVLLAVAVAVSFVAMPLEFALAALILLLIRTVVVWLQVRRISKRLGEEALWSKYLLYDLWSPIESLWVNMLLRRKDPRAWR